MSARICPKCFNTLSDFNHYFCGYCGDILPSSLVSKPIVKDVVIVNYAPYLAAYFNASTSLSIASDAV